MAIRFGPSGPVIDGTRRAHETRPWLARGDPEGATAARTTHAPATPPASRPPDDPARDPPDEAPGEPDAQ
jgi:hypothetical protein